MMGKLINKSFWLGAGIAYLVYSGIAGMAMKAAMPGLNPLGVAYIGLTWPVPMTCLAIHSDCSVVPPPKYAWIFFYSDAQP
jgi:hypothetical protein